MVIYLYITRSHCGFPTRSHEMRPIVTDVARGVVCTLGTRASCAKAAEPIEMPFGRLTHLGPRNYVIDEVPDPHGKGNVWGGGTCQCVLTYLGMSALRPPPATLFARRPQRTNAFAGASGDMTRRRCGLLPNYTGHLLSTHGNRQSVDVVHCLCFLFVWLRISLARINLVASSFARRFRGVHFGELCSPRCPKSDESARGKWTLGSACVDNRQSPSLTVLVWVLLHSW